MNQKTLETLELPKILERLATYTSFSASRNLALALHPTTDYATAWRRQQEAAEAARLLELHPRLSLGGAHDIRTAAQRAAKEGVLEPQELLEIQSTLGAARSLRATVLRLEGLLPHLAAIAAAIVELPRVEAEIGRCLNPRGEVLDGASPRLGEVRAQVRQAHDQLLSRLQEILHSPRGRLVAQEPIITQREGRYVIPIKAEFKGQLRGLVHDVSASGATLFLEPLAIVELQNQWHQLQLEEQREVERILRQLSLLVGEVAWAIDDTVAALAASDLALARAKYGQALRATQPHLLPHADGVGLHLRQARHPLLRDPITPIDVEVGDPYCVLLITGPNTGGKTVALKTAGILSLMALSGLPIPAAEGSQVPVYDGVFADIGDEQSIEQSLSTFSSHLGNIIAALEGATVHSLVLLDELAAGTDPAEGAALARAILTEFQERGTTVVATTHHGELKAFASLTPGMQNAAVEFDPETLAPTYRLRLGLPGRSNAMAIARRLGLAEEVVGRAQSFLSPQEMAVDALLAQLQAEREAIDEALGAAQAAQSEAETLGEQLAQRLNQMEEEREAARQAMQEEVRAEFEDLRQEMRRLSTELAGALSLSLRQSSGQAPGTGALPPELTAAVEAVGRRLPRAPRRHRIAPDELRPGSAVWVAGLNQMAEVLSPPNSLGEVEVRLGRLRAKVPATELRQAETGPTPAAPPPLPTKPPPPPTELHLRGLLVEPALELLDRYLNDAFLSGVSSVRVVHGKGTGAMRTAVRDVLSRHPLVKSYQTADRYHGGEGVTVVEMAG